MNIQQIIVNALKEDIGPGDYSALSTIPLQAMSQAKLIVKDEGILAGMEEAMLIFKEVDSNLQLETFLSDGNTVKYGDIAFTVHGKARSILSAERLVLNIMQRMSGIATYTAKVVQQVADLHVKVLDTRKTTPLIRVLEKKAVLIGGGHNHRFGLYDMIMIKDNHVDYAGGIEKAILAANNYIKENNLTIKIEIEVRNLDELQQVLAIGQVDRIMLDNFSPQLMTEAVKIVDKRYETEASGGITIDNVRAYGLTGVDYISMGSLTHSVKSLDLSLKAF